VDDQTIRAIVEEIAPALTGHAMGKVFQLSRLSFSIDFRTNDGRYLFLSLDPAAPRIYMIRRSVRELEKQSLPPSSFVLALRKQLGGATLRHLTKDEGDRIVRLSFDARDAMGNTHSRTLVAQMTGRAANLLLLDERGYIIDALRPTHNEGQQQIGDLYEAPPLKATLTPPSRPVLERGSFDTLSEAADDYYQRREAARAFDARAAAARDRVRRAVMQRTKLHRHLLKDLAAHGDADEHKRVGDLLLANIGSAERRGRSVLVTDYYAEDTPRIELEIDENSTIQEEAARRFARYGKAKRAAQEITRRLGELEVELESLAAQQSELERIIKERDEAALSDFDDEKKVARRGPATGRKAAESVPGARRYRSSDGYEILVGRGARDNDHLTFRVARPHDLWLHAADYPGSHVVIRNPTRAADLPHRTLIEAAQLAAQFSQARRDAKVDVHYTQRKFLSKPKGAAPGLVRMSSFRTITVEPAEKIERI
jgi:predicted ribosome quality control (RQC) complex YloA/Tae2 family protein